MTLLAVVQPDIPEAIWAALGAMPDAAVLLDDRGTIVAANPNSEHSFGYRQSDLVTAHLDILLIDRCRAICAAELRRVFDEPGRKRVGPGIGVTARHRDGREIPIEISFGTLDVGGYRLALVSLRDGEPLRALQAELETARTQLSAHADAMVMLDHEGRITFADSAWQRFAREMLDLETIGVGAHYLTACLGVAALHTRLADLLAGRANRIDVVCARHSDTSLRWLRVTARVIDQGPHAVMILHSDHTAQYLKHEPPRIQQAIAATPFGDATVADVCEQLLELVCPVLGWQWGAVWLPDGASGSLQCSRTWKDPGCDLDAFAAESMSLDTAPGQGLVGRAHAERDCIWATDLLDEAALLRGASLATTPLRAALAFPIRVGDNVIAVVELMSRTQRVPEPTVLELVRIASLQLGDHFGRRRAEEERAAAATAVLESKAQLEALLESAPAVIISVDRQGRIRFINQVIPPYKLQDVVGVPWLTFIRPDEHQRMTDIFELVLATGETQRYEVVVSPPTEQRFESIMGPVRRGDEIVGVMIVARDVTASHKLEAELMIAQRMAAIGTLAAGVAHEINTPVQFVSDSVQFLRNATNDVFGAVSRLAELHKLGATPATVEAAAAVFEELDLEYLQERTPAAFERCLDGLGRVASIVSALKQFAHPTQREMAPADLNQAIMTTLTVARNEYRYIAELETDLGEIPFVVCHVGDFNQVVLNLVVNAAHAIGDVVADTGDKGKLVVRTTCEAESVLVSISDTGGGIPEPARAHVFEPFFTTKEVGRGTGQGLSLAWTVITEKHLGEIWFETESGVGTTFFVRLPLHGTPAP